MNDNSLILKIENELKKRHWSKIDFCAQLGISSQTYNNWRNRGVPHRRLADIAAVLNWDVSQLLLRNVGVKESSIQYDTLTPKAKEVAARWQTLPPNLQQHILDLLDSTERTLKNGK